MMMMITPLEIKAFQKSTELLLILKSELVYVRFSIISLSQQPTYVSLEIIRNYVVAFVCLHFALIYIYIYIYICVCVCVSIYVELSLIGRPIYQVDNKKSQIFPDDSVGET